jgi:hypothetical protein
VPLPSLSCLGLSPPILGLLGNTGLSAHTGSHEPLLPHPPHPPSVQISQPPCFDGFRHCDLKCGKAAVQRSEASWKEEEGTGHSPTHCHHSSAGATLPSSPPSSPSFCGALELVAGMRYAAGNPGVRLSRPFSQQDLRSSQPGPSLKCSGCTIGTGVSKRSFN